jgi:hypothetical protein
VPERHWVHDQGDVEVEVGLWAAYLRHLPHYLIANKEAEWHSSECEEGESKTFMLDSNYS